MEPASGTQTISWESDGWTVPSASRASRCQVHEPSAGETYSFHGAHDAIRESSSSRRSAIASAPDRSVAAPMTVAPSRYHALLTT